LFFSCKGDSQLRNASPSESQEQKTNEISSEVGIPQKIAPKAQTGGIFSQIYREEIKEIKEVSSPKRQHT
jgi:hypothetical protein